MNTYQNELEALNIWRFHCIKKTERLNNFSIMGRGISDREIAEIEINKEYYKRLENLKQRYGIKNQAIISIKNPTPVLNKLDKALDRLVI